VQGHQYLRLAHAWNGDRHAPPCEKIDQEDLGLGSWSWEPTHYQAAPLALGSPHYAAALQNRVQECQQRERGSRNAQEHNEIPRHIQHGPL